MSSNQFPQNLDFKEIIERVAIRSQKSFWKLEFIISINVFHEFRGMNHKISMRLKISYQSFQT